MKKVLLGLFALSAISMASTEKGTFSNRIGISVANKGNEKWDNSKLDSAMDDNNIYDESYGINYKLLYNVTDRFRWGAELGYETVAYSDEFSKLVDESDDYIGLLTYGVTGEYDVYQNDQLSVYLTGSMGGAYNEYKYDALVETITLTAKAYAKLGLGTRFQNGLGLEVGSKAVAYELETDYLSFSDDMIKQQYYFEVNFTF
jgi:outer membrane protein with beta-barrel domain